MVHDKIFINGLRINTTIGTLAWEKQLKQAVLLDLELAVDINQAQQSDNISDALNYAEVAEELTKYVQKQKCELLETLAARIVDLLQQQFSPSWLKLSISKPGALSNAKEVSIIIERGKD